MVPTMRFAAALFFFALAQTAIADGFEAQLVLPTPIDLVARREKLLAGLPMLEDISSRKAISSYRQALDRYNTLYVQGFLAEIVEVCENLNTLERNVNAEWDKGNISRNDKNDYDTAIRNEREKCSDRFATRSPYYRLYYEVLGIYREKDEESATLLSQCNSKESCRNS